MVDKNTAKLHKKVIGCSFSTIFRLYFVIFCLLQLMNYTSFAKKRLATDVPVRAFSINDIFYSASNINQSK